MSRWETSRKLALSMPEAVEQDHFGCPSFRVRGKIFAQLSSGSGMSRAIVKLTAADQVALIMSAPEIFSSVPQWGRHGWTYIQLDTVELSLLRSLFRQSWKIVAPKKLVALLGKGHSSA